MSHLKRLLDGQDPDYEDNTTHEAKRLRILERNAKAEFSHKASIIIQEEFNKELTNKEKEVFEIEERLHQAQKTLHLLRYAIVSAFYNKKQIQGTSNADDKHQRIHPAVKKLIGKQPPKWEPLQQRPSKYRQVASTSGNIDWGPGAVDTSKSMCNMLDTAASTNGNNADAPTVSEVLANTKQEPSDTSNKQLGTKETVTKVPRYIPPKIGPKSFPVIPVNDTQRMRHKTKKRLVIGNISKWVPVDTREDAASHKWMMYVRGPKESPDISDFVSKVRFFLHPSYRPHDIAEVTSPPFHLSKRGWGEFPVRVQIHFCHPRNKPVDVIHHLKLDRTYTGLQTLGAETVVDIWLHTGRQENGHIEEETSIEVLGANKKDNENKNSSSLCDLSSESSTSTVAATPHMSNINEDNARTISVKKPKVEPDLDSSSQSLNVHVCNNPFSNSVPSAISLDHDYIGSMSLMNTCVDSGFYSEKSGDETSTPGHLSQSSEENEKSKPCPDPLEPQLLEKVDNVVDTKENKYCLKEKGTYKESVNSETSVDCSAMVKQTDVEDSTKQKNNQKKIGSPSRPYSATSILVPNNQTAVATNEGNNNSGATKLTTLVKCMDKSGNVFYITLGRANLKQQAKSGNVSQQKAGLPQESTSPGKPPPLLGATSLLIPKEKQSKQEQQLELTNTLLRSTSATVVNSSTSVLLPRIDAKALLSQKITPAIPGQLPGKKMLLSNSDLLTPKQRQLFRCTNIPVSASAASSVDGGSTASKLVPSTVANAAIPVRMVPANQLLIESNLGQTCLVSKMQSEKQSVNSASQEKRVANVQIQQSAAEEERKLIIKDGQFYVVKNPQVPSSCVAKQAQSTSETTKKTNKSIVTLENSRHIQVPVETSSIALSKLEAAVTVNSIIPSQTATKVIKMVDNTSAVNHIKKTVLAGTSIKSGSSLLKKSVNSTNVVAPTSTKLEIKEEKPLKLKNREDAKFILSGRTLVLSKTHRKHMGGSRKSQFEEQLRNAVTTCRFADMSHCVRWLLRHMPLVSPLACFPEYKVLHPYAAPDRQTFLKWNIGKRRAAEWCRAKAIQKALLTCGQYKETKVWSAHAIAVWAKLHGYTPLPPPNKETLQQKEIKQQHLPTTYSEPVKIMDWLVSTNHNADLNSSAEMDMELDIISIELPEHKVVKEEIAVKDEELNSKALILEINSPDMEAECVHVRETARELGFKLMPEEIVPGALYGAAERVIVEALRSLVDDLLRRSLCKAMKRNSNRYPETLSEEYVKAALLSRSEFDIFTNSGLGVQVTDTS